MNNHTREEITTVSHDNPEKIIKSTTVSTDNLNRREFTEKKTIFRFYHVVWYILAVIEIVLGFRFILKMLGANPYNGFASFIYSLSEPFVIPFVGIVSISYNGSNIIEWFTLIAMAVYFVLALIIIEFVKLIKPVSREEVEDTVDNA